MSSTWEVLNSLQILVNLSLIDITLPSNLLAFNSQIISMCQLDFFTSFQKKVTNYILKDNIE